MKNELKKLVKHFKENCNVRVVSTIEERTFPHWKRLVFDSLNCDDMMKISEYIKTYFSEKGNYSHLLPQLHAYNYNGNSCICLTFDIEEIKKHLK